MAYERITGPLGPRRADIQAAIIASTIANANRGKRGKRFTPEDFIPTWDRGRRHAVEQTPQDHLAVIRQLNRSLGGRDLTQGGGDGGDPGGSADQDRRRPVRRRKGRR